VHIPDGYLSPTTVIVSYLAVAPLWVYGFKRLKRSLNEETLPMIGALTALSFVIMMFNIPIPGGTSGHAVGAALIAIMFDPWIASIAVSLVLFIQAVVFADGGISALAVNALGMAFGGAFGGYYLFKVLRSYYCQAVFLIAFGLAKTKYTIPFVSSTEIFKIRLEGRGELSLLKL